MKKSFTKTVSSCMALGMILSMLIGTIPVSAFTTVVYNYTSATDGLAVTDGYAKALSSTEGRSLAYHGAWPSPTPPAPAVVTTQTINNFYGRTNDKSIQYTLYKDQTYVGQNFGAVYANPNSQSTTANVMVEASVFVPNIKSSSGTAYLSVPFSVRKDGTAGNQKFFAIVFQKDGTIAFQNRQGTPSTAVQVFDNYQENQWYTLSMLYTYGTTISDDRLSFYVDGTLVANNIETYIDTRPERFDWGISLGGSPTGGNISTVFDDVIFGDAASSTPYDMIISKRNSDISVKPASTSDITVSNPTFAPTGSATVSKVFSVPNNMTVDDLCNEIVPPTGGNVSVVGINNSDLTTIPVSDGITLIGSITNPKLVSKNASGGMRVYDMEVINVVDTASDAEIKSFTQSGVSVDNDNNIISVAPLTTSEQLISSKMMAHGNAEFEILDNRNREVTTGVLSTTMKVTTVSANKENTKTYEIQINDKATVFNVRVPTPEDGTSQQLWSKPTGKVSENQINNMGFTDVYQGDFEDTTKTSTAHTVKNNDGRIWGKITNHSYTNEAYFQRLASTISAPTTVFPDIKIGDAAYFVTEFSVIPLTIPAAAPQPTMLPVAITPFVYPQPANTSEPASAPSLLYDRSTGTNEVYFDSDSKIKLRTSKSNGSPIQIGTYEFGKEYKFTVVAHSLTGDFTNGYQLKFDTYMNGNSVHTNNTLYFRTGTNPNFTQYFPAALSRWDFKIRSSVADEATSAMITGLKSYYTNSFNINYINNPLRIHDVELYDGNALVDDITEVTGNTARLKITSEAILPLSKSERFSFIGALYEDIINDVKVSNRNIDITTQDAQTIGKTFTNTLDIDISSITDITKSFIKLFTFESIENMKPYKSPVTIDKSGIK